MQISKGSDFKRVGPFKSDPLNLNLLIYNKIMDTENPYNPQEVPASNLDAHQASETFGWESTSKPTDQV